MPLDSSSYTWKVKRSNSVVEQFEQEILPWFFSKGEELIHDNGNGGYIHSRFFSTNQSNKELMILIAGMNDSSLCFAEIVFDLKSKGLDFLVIDPRGQGFSSRELSSSTIHINSFEDYIDDLFCVLEKLPNKYKKQWLFSHSSGCLIGLAAQQRNPNLFDGAMLISPQFKSGPSSLPQVLYKLELGLLNLFGLGKINFWEKFIFKTNKSERGLMMQNNVKNYPQLACEGVTISWHFQTSRAITTIFKNAKDLKLPIIVLQAGNDPLTYKKAQDYFVMKIKNSKILKFENAHHNIILESENIRNKVLVQINKFLSES